MSNGINFSGLASGMDTAAIIDALLQVARQPINRLSQKKSDYQAKTNLISTLSSRLSTLRSRAQDLDSLNDFQNFTAKSSNTSALTVSAASDAKAGTYSLTVDSLAQAERTYSDAFAAKDQSGLVGSGTLSIQVGSDTAVDITIDGSTESLENVAKKINDSDADVTASVMYDGTNYRLVVGGNRTGNDGSITFNEGGSLLLNLDEATNQKQAAKDAQATLDGITITSNTNQIKDAIAGVTINLVEETAAPVTVTVAPDLDATEEQITDLLNSYNQVIGFINDQFRFSGDGRTDTLMGDGTTRSIKSKLQSVLASQVDGLSEPYTALSRIGVETASDGTMSLNSADFRTAMATNAQSVAELFVKNDHDEDTANDGIAVTLGRSIDSMLQSSDGLLATHTSGFSRRIDDIDNRIASIERNVETYEAGLRRQFASLETVLSGLQSQGNFLSAQLSGGQS